MKNKLIMKMTSGLLLCTTVLYTVPVFGFAKDETVYSNLKNNGDRYNTTVTTKVTNSDKLNLISEMTDLLNIENTSGDETFTQDGSKIVWNANGNDIYYKGESKKELPITCNIKYKLDGNDISVEDIAGKSGKVTVTLEYENKDSHIVRVNGTDTTLYTPFVVVAGTVINNEKNKNIEIKNGKAIDNGTKTVVMGMAMPGLQESLDVSKDTVDIPSSIEITMDAEDFEMSNILTYVTPKVIEKDDLDIFNKLDDVYAKVSELQSASNELVDGTNQLKDYTSQVATGANTLSSSVGTACNGASQIKAEVEKSTKALQADKSDAVDQATLNAIKAQAGQTATQEINSKLAAIKTQAGALAEVSNEQVALIKKGAVAAVDAELVNEKSDMYKMVAAACTVDEAEIKATAEKNVEDKKADIIAEAQAGYPMPLTQYEQGLVLAVAKSSAGTAAVTTAKKAASELKDSLKTAAETIAQTAAELAVKQAAPTIASETAEKLAPMVASDVASQTAGTVATQVGNTAKKTFTKQVVSQMSELGNGLGQLTNGLSQINSGAATLANVTKQVSDGANTLSEGMNKFNSTGIEKICNYINGDAKNITERVKKLADLSDQYNTFTMSQDGEEAQVKFIMIADAVKKDEAKDQKDEKAIVNESNKDDSNSLSVQDNTSEK